MKVILLNEDSADVSILFCWFQICLHVDVLYGNSNSRTEFSLDIAVHRFKVHVQVYTHFVTRSLRHPGDEMHIVSPGYTHFVTLCTSSPG